MGPYLTGADFTVADAYLFVVHSWASNFAIDLASFPHLAEFAWRVTDRPTVQAALIAERSPWLRDILRGGSRRPAGHPPCRNDPDALNGRLRHGIGL